MAITINGNSGANTAVSLPVASQGASAQQAAAKATVAVPDPAPQPQPRPEELLQAMESIKRTIDIKSPNSLLFSVDDATGKTIVKVTDAVTGEMIRQIPSEEMLEIARSLDKMQGMLLHQKV